MRAHSLDALRGYAILTMILSGTVAFGILPGWMYHTQVPPPNHVFDPSIYGISWVDLVFPFFLFSMGAAFPLSLGRQYRKGVSKARLCYKSVLRGLKLTFFAIYVQHLFYFVLGYDSTNVDFVISLAGFVWMFPLFMKNPFHLPTRWADTVNGLAYVIAALWIYVQPYAEGKPFSLYDSDIIILILADVAVFGSIIYLYTMDKPHARLLVLPILLGLFLSWKTMGSWQKALVDFTPFGWMFKWEYLRYLFIIIPGTMAGEMLERWIARGTEVTADSAVKRHRAPWLTVCSIALVIVNLCCLYGRYLVTGLALTALLLVVMYVLLRTKEKDDRDFQLWTKLYRFGAYLVMLGWCFEAFQGGIRKDDVTFSYLFLTAGLAFIVLLMLSIVCDYYHCRWVSVPLEECGMNPLFAYVTPMLLVIPILALTGVYGWMSIHMDHNVWLGFFKGVIITALCMLSTMVATRLKWFWKT
jgi:predicted acyltransferase